MSLLQFLAEQAAYDFSSQQENPLIGHSCVSFLSLFFYYLSRQPTISPAFLRQLFMLIVNNYQNIKYNSFYILC